MGAFSRNSYRNLKQCHPLMQTLFLRVVLVFDCTIITGYRGAKAQQLAFDSGHSQLQWYQSPHNQLPSLAVDAAPYPIRWDDRERFHLFAGYVIGRAHDLNMDVQWGGDWDMDWDIHDNRFDDLTHFQLLNPPE